jgi:hypothetical protein
MDIPPQGLARRRRQVLGAYNEDARLAVEPLGGDDLGLCRFETYGPDCRRGRAGLAPCAIIDGVERVERELEKEAVLHRGRAGPAWGHHEGRAAGGDLDHEVDGVVGGQAVFRFQPDAPLVDARLDEARAELEARLAAGADLDGARVDLLAVDEQVRLQARLGRAA